MNSSWDKFKADNQRDQLIKSGRIFSLIGLAVIFIFALMDSSVVGIQGTLLVRICGMIPMVLFLSICLTDGSGRITVSNELVFWCGMLLILGVTGMTAALLYKVLVDVQYADAVGLAGTVAGNLLAVYAGGLLRGIPRKRGIVSIASPYLILSILLLFRQIPSVRWVFHLNVLFALPLVVISVWQKEKGSDQRLRALWDLNRERESLEETVQQRTLELSRSLEEKSVLLQELYHRTKNNMQLIASLLNMQSGFSRNAVMKEEFREAENRIHTMAIVHEKLYNLRNLVYISVRDYVSSLINMLRSSFSPGGKVRIRKEIEDFSIDIETAIPIGLLLNELLSNAFKHAFPEHEGTITVSVFKHNDLINLRVADSGIGLPPDFNFRKSETIGFSTIFTLGESQLNGDVVFNTNQGLNCTVTFIPPRYKRVIS